MPSSSFFVTICGHHIIQCILKFNNFFLKYTKMKDFWLILEKNGELGGDTFFFIFAAATIPLRLRNLHKGSLKFKGRGTLQTMHPL